jgi:hypothetical protein
MFASLTANPPPTVVTGAIPIMPVKNLAVMIVCKFVAVAIAADKQMKINISMSTDIHLPYISDNGLTTRDG